MKKKIKEPSRIELTEQELEELKNKIRSGQLSSKEQELLIDMLQGFNWLSRMLQAKKMSIRKLMRLFGVKTEKKKHNKNDDEKPPQSGRGDDHTKKSNNKGHGKNGTDKYTDAKRVFHEHKDLKVGDRCPACNKGNLYEIDPGQFIHVKGSPSLQATIHEAQKLRCSGCGEIFTANIPKEARKQKYDETADVMIAISKYGKGVPFYRQDKWQKYLGVPMPASTQWERVEELASSVRPVFNQLIRKAAQGDLSYVDDTTNRIIDFKNNLKKGDRCGIYTTGVVSKVNEKTINLFFTGNKHAGENLDRLLEQRDPEIAPMIQMSDALASNHAKQAMTIECLCLTHGRRNFVDANVDRPQECDYVIHLLGKVYHNDNIAKKRLLSDEERLAFHKKRSGPVMKKLRRWMLKSFYLKKIEPNEPTGMAIQYMLNHWKGLTQFLRILGAPIDNTICERLIKKVILHRKNSLFFKTRLGAYVADIIMSLIETCVSAGKNPYRYLVNLHRNRKEVFNNPEKFLPWNFEENIIGYQTV